MKKTIKRTIGFFLTLCSIFAVTTLAACNNKKDDGIITFTDCSGTEITMKKEVNRSPLFYVGDKYKLISEIKTYFPQCINRFIEPFVGGGSP